ncbi:outer membrane protein OmpA-like peptidoglycan-associated protein [Pedobacter sp. CG_S7]|uniref:OmpA family protein n=1 Tax=Pedobacter sp. CG_S7 TaxID=3143930 RepID=UPI00339413B0
MITKYKMIKRGAICTLMLLVAQSTVQAQTEQPTWWFGLSGAANTNFYDGTTQRLNNDLIVPAAFHKGNGIRPFGSLLIEYRPSRVWGGLLNLGYDGRGGKFDEVMAPCDCPANLETNTSYLTIEPSLRFSPGGGNFYLFAGPRVGINLQKDFSYTQLRQPNTDAELSEMRKTVISGQVGVGYDISLSSPNSTTKYVISPFVSFHPYFGQDPRSIESWSMTTVRTGVALKFGKAKKEMAELPIAVPVDEVQFFVRAPQDVPVKLQLSETLPLLNYVFFDEGSNAIPSRYVLLSEAAASNFKEEQLQKEESTSATGRSASQLNVYHNILNILGDRLRTNSGTSINLSGASANGPKEGKVFAENIKKYIVGAFGINESRIITQGRTKPLIPSEQPGGTKELDLLRAGDRRVDIQSNSSELLMEVGGGMMKPVQMNATQTDPLAGQVVFNTPGAEKMFTSYTIEITDANGKSKIYGPFKKDEERIPAQAILGDQPAGDYKIVMLGTTKNGLPVRKESTVQLVSQQAVTQTGSRYSILFNFNKATTIASYEDFLTKTVAPLITNGSTVVIHGHTDIIGSEAYNAKLSQSRAQEAQSILERVLRNAGISNVKFQTNGFGEEESLFDNNLPEERFYNRTVIIDIIPVK